MNKTLAGSTYRDLLAYPSYFLVVLASTMSVFGFILFQVVLVWLAYQWTNSPVQAGIAILSCTAPYVFFGLVGGVYADRWNRKQVVMWCQACTIAMGVALIGMALAHIQSIWFVSVAAFLITSFRCFLSPANRALVPQMLPQQLWPKGNSVWQFCVQFSMSLAPIGAGLLVAYASPLWAFVVFLLVNVLSFACILPIIVRHERAYHRVRVVRELIHVFSYLRTKPPLFWSILLFGAVLLMETGMQRLGFPAVSDHVWHAGSTGYGTILTMIGAGNALGALWFGRLQIRAYAACIFISWAVWGVTLLGVGESPNIYVAAVFALLNGTAQTFHDLPTALMIQNNVPDDQLGKVFSASSTVAFIGESGSSLLIGPIIRVAGTSMSFLLVACALVIIGLVALFTVGFKQTALDPQCVKNA